MLLKKIFKFLITTNVYLVLISSVIAKDSIKIGISTFLSGGAASSFGVPLKESMELILDAINEGTVPPPYNSKGIAGAKVEYFFIDEAGGATKQVTEFRNMVERHKVDIVMGYVSSGDCLAIPAVAEELKKLTILTDCGTPRVFEERNYKYVFRTGPHAAMDNISGARYMIKRGIGIDRIAGINQNYAWGQDSWADFKNSIEILNPNSKFVSEQFPKIFSGQYGSEISAISIAKPSLIHSSLWGADLESFIIQGNTRGLFKNTNLFLSAGDHILPSIKKNMPDGIIIGARGPHGDFAPDNNLSIWLKSLAKEKLGAKITTQPMHKAAMTALFVKKAFDEAAKLKGSFPSDDEVIKIMEGLSWETPSGNVYMKLGSGHQAIQHTAVGMTKWDEEEARVRIVDIEYFQAECVNPPEGITAIEWIRQGFPGAICD